MRISYWVSDVCSSVLLQYLNYRAATRRGTYFQEALIDFASRRTNAMFGGRFQNLNNGISHRPMQYCAGPETSDTSSAPCRNWTIEPQGSGGHRRLARSEKRSDGKRGVSTCRFR